MSKFQECANNGNAMTNTFDWAGLTEEIVKVHFAKYPLDLLHLLRTRIEAAFVPVEALATADRCIQANHDEWLVMKARAEAAEAIADDVHKALWVSEARIKVLEEALRHISLGSQNSSTTKEHLGIYARQALGAEQ